MNSVLFSPDTSINQLSLYNRASIESQLGDVHVSLDKEATLPSVTFLNSKKNQYLTLVFHPGDLRNTFSEFEVGTIDNTVNKKPLKVLDMHEFVSENNIKLGMFRNQVIKLKGSNFIKQTNGIRYVIDDFEKSPFLKKYNMPLYYAQYEFDKKDVLVKFAFGFEYP
jgi:hypothetical protein